MINDKIRLALYHLEGFNGVFRQFWELGTMQFTDEIPSACVTFDNTGQQIAFKFNKTFYDKLTIYDLAFIIGHECMHVLLYHGLRYWENTSYQLNHEIWNTAADISIHEIMFREFGFEFNKLSEYIQEFICTHEKFFKEEENIKRGATMDYYFEKLCNRPGMKHITLDVHNFSKDYAYGSKNIAKKIFEQLSNVEKKELYDKLKDKDGQQAGKESGDRWWHVNLTTLHKKKWEMVIKEWAQAFLMADKFDWSKKNRRISSLNSRLILPAHLELDIKKIKVWLFMDTSGSCFHLADRFFSAAASLPPKFFEPRLFCFDTSVYETTLSSRKVYGGGGTAFDIIQHHIDRNGPHPDCIFVITDGYGNKVEASDPKKWHVFLTSDHKECFPETCKFHSFEEFE